MIPILYDMGETEFLSNGIGRLSDCISCKVVEERDGIYECTFVYPMTGVHYDEIKEGRIIYCTHDDTRNPQPFDIYKRSAPMSGLVTFYAHHISYRLGNVICKPFTASSAAQVFATIKDKTMNDCPFEFWTDKEATGNFYLTSPKAVKELLGGTQGSVLDVYGKGDYEWDKWQVKLYLNRGSDTDVEIRYGKNLADIQQDLDYGQTYSAIAPFWYDASADESVFLPEGIIVAENAVMYDDLTTETGKTLETENGEPLEAAYTLIKAVPMDLSDRWETRPTEQQLRDKATSILNASDAWLPKENIQVDFIALWQSDEYAEYAPLQRVRLCDTVSVIYPELGVQGIRKRVIKVEYDSLLDRYTSIELGQAQTSFPSVLKADTVTEVLKTVPTKSSLENAISAATQLITGGLGGHVVIGTNADGQPNEILILDTEDIATAVNVLRINENGIGFSSDGYDGTYRSAWTLDGHFVADFIDTGTLTGNIIKTGIITDKLGKNYWNLETGDISITFDPGSGAAVTQADLQRVENNARTWADDAESNAKDYVDESFLDVPTHTEVTGEIEANIRGLRTEFASEYSIKGDTTTQVQLWYYESTSPTQLFGGEWSTTAPTWSEGTYIWEKNRYIKGDGTYTESDPVCKTGHTGVGEPGQPGDSAYTLWISTDKGTSTPKETPLTVTFTAHVGQGETNDIDPSGSILAYTWYQIRDGGVQEFAGGGKTYTVTVTDGYCDDRSSVWFGIVGDAEFYYLMDENGNILKDENDYPLEVA